MSLFSTLHHATQPGLFPDSQKLGLLGVEELVWDFLKNVGVGRRVKMVKWNFKTNLLHPEKPLQSSCSNLRWKSSAWPSKTKTEREEGSCQNTGWHSSAAKDQPPRAPPLPRVNYYMQAIYGTQVSVSDIVLYLRTQISRRTEVQGQPGLQHDNTPLEKKTNKKNPI